MTEHPILDLLRSYGCTVEPCGSRVTCDPAPTDTDADYLVECKGQRMVSEAVDAMGRAGFSWEGGVHYQMAAEDGFMSWRHAGGEDINLIVTADAAFAARHRIATDVCKMLNLQNKVDRIVLFQAILYRVPAVPIPQPPFQRPATPRVPDNEIPF